MWKGEELKRFGENKIREMERVRRREEDIEKEREGGGIEKRGR